MQLDQQDVNNKWEQVKTAYLRTSKAPFTWKEDDPSGRIILQVLFGLYAKLGLLGTTFHLVSLAAVLSVVTQRSSPQTAAHIRTTFLSLCILCANEIADIVSYVTNRSTVNCNQHFFSRFECSMERTPKKVLQSDLCFIFHRSREKIIFGKSSFDFPAIISSCLDVHVSCYSATGELSIAKHGIDDLSSLKRPLIILKGSNIN